MWQHLWEKTSSSIGNQNVAKPLLCNTNFFFSILLFKWIFFPPETNSKSWQIVTLWHVETCKGHAKKVHAFYEKCISFPNSVSAKPSRSLLVLYVGRNYLKSSQSNLISLENVNLSATLPQNFGSNHHISFMAFSRNRDFPSLYPSSYCSIAKVEMAKLQFQMEIWWW